MARDLVEHQENWLVLGQRFQCIENHVLRRVIRVYDNYHLPREVGQRLRLSRHQKGCRVKEHEPCRMVAAELGNHLLHPRAVAVFGASEDRTKFGGRIIHFLIQHGFPGRIVPINPRRKEILGHPAFGSLTDAPPGVEVAILAVPVSQLLPALEQCAAAGVGCCVIITTGFAEADEAGAELQQCVLDIAQPAGMRIVGPNCMGLINPGAQLALCSSIVLDTERLMTGRIGLVSQSGALMVSMFDRAAGEGIGFSAAISLGNQSDLEICDFLDYFVDDPATDALCVYIEGLRDPARFVRAAAACKRAGKPMIVVKTGKTDDGVRAARSHTASLAGSYDAFAAVCSANGVVLVDDPVTMIRVADLLLRYPKLTSDGIGIVSGSGGGNGIMVDRLVTMTKIAGDCTVVARAAYDWTLFQANRRMDVYNQTFNWHTIEGPCVVKHDGKYYCFYSGSNWQTPRYGVDYVVADNPLGPYSGAGEHARVLSGIPKKVFGPGGNAVITGPDGATQYIVYHAWNRKMTRRQLCIDKLEWTAEGPRATPTTTPQPMP